MKRLSFLLNLHSPVGRIDKALDEGPKRGWTLLSIKDDWKSVHPEAQ